MAERMKDSGNQWIGEIPESWNINRVLNLLDMPITDGPHTTPDMEDEGVPFVSAEAVSFGNGKIDFDHIWGYISEEFYRECCKKYIPKLNDIYMIKSGATTGRVAIVDSINSKFTIWSPLAVFRCNTDKMIPKFMFYSLQSDYFQMQIQIGWTYGTQQNIGMRTLEHLKICAPPLKEQQAIADFLDRRCAQIDDVIADLDKQLDKLLVARKSYVYEMVTTGAHSKDPFVPLKKTNIGWAPCINKDWDICRVSDLTTSRSGGTPDRDNLQYWEDGTIPWMASGEVNKVYVTETNEFITPKAIANSSAKIIAQNSVMVALNGQGKTKGMSAILKIDAACNQSLCAFTCFEDELHYEYLFWCFQAMYLYLRSMSGDGIRDGLAASYVKKQKIPVPPIKEQIKIATAINKKTETIDMLIQMKIKQINDIKAHKKSLIYEYVTGKKRVKEVDACAN